jgi:hypothetical protein
MLSIRGVTWNGTFWIAVGRGNSANNNTVYISYDGIHWSKQTAGSNLFGSQAYSVAARRLIEYPKQYVPAIGDNWASPPPETYASALDRIAAAFNTINGFAIP